MTTKKNKLYYFGISSWTKSSKSLKIGYFNLSLHQPISLSVARNPDFLSYNWSRVGQVGKKAQVGTKFKNRVTATSQIRAHVDVARTRVARAVRVGKKI